MKNTNPSQTNKTDLISSEIGEPLYLQDIEITARKMQAQEFARLMKALASAFKNLFKSNDQATDNGASHAGGGSVAPRVA